MTTVNAATAKASMPRRMLADSWRLALELLLGILGFGMVYEGYSPDNPPDLDAVGLVVGLDILCGLAAFVLYPFRHRFPVPVVAALVLLSIPSAVAAGITLMGVASLATRRKPWEIAGISVLFIGSMLISDRMASTVLIPVGEALAWWETTITALVLLAVMVLSGMYIGGRRQLAAAQREQLHSAQREREAQIHAAKADERTRIAREMHDVLAHRLSLVALHSGALEYRSDLTPEETRQTAGIIRENSHLALGELREVLGMLRDPNTLREDESARPQPTLEQLEQILADSRAAGTAVNLELEPGARERLDALPQSTGRHLYRIIQEVLTNARRHAPRQEVRLLVGGCGERLFLRAANRLDVGPREAPEPGSPPSSGLGLTGLAERVRLAGGELQIEPEEQGEFVLKVWLPWGT